MGKVIKLKEQDIRNIITKIMSEQISFDGGDNPLSKIEPSKFRQTLQPKSDSGLAKGAEPNGDLLQKKIKVRLTFKKLIYFLNDLIVSSGINPETNNLVGDLEKVQEKFENLWGDPDLNSEDDE